MTSMVQLFSHGSPAELGSASGRSSAFAFSRREPRCSTESFSNQRCVVQPVEIHPREPANPGSTSWDWIEAWELRKRALSYHGISTVENYQVTVSDHHWLAILKHHLPVDCGYTIIVVIIACCIPFSLVGYTTSQVFLPALLMPYYWLILYHSAINP